MRFRQRLYSQSKFASNVVYGLFKMFFAGRMLIYDGEFLNSPLRGRYVLNHPPWVRMLLDSAGEFLKRRRREIFIDFVF